MSLERDLRDLLTQTLTRNAFSGYNTRGDPSYSTTATTYAAQVEGKQHLVVGADGRDVTARTLVYVGTSSTGGVPAVSLQDKVTLPDSSVLRLLAVDTLRDEAGVHHQVLHG